MDMTLKGQWNQLQGKVKEKWGELTDDDIKKAEGDFDQLVGIVQERYGYAAAQAKQQVAEFVQSLKSDGDSEPASTSSAHRISG